MGSSLSLLRRLVRVAREHVVPVGLVLPASGIVHIPEAFGGEDCFCGEKVDAWSCVLFSIQYRGVWRSLRATLIITPMCCSSRALPAVPYLRRYARLVVVSDGGTIKMCARGPDNIAGLLSEARARIAGVESARLNLRAEAYNRALAAMTGVVAAYLKRGGPIRALEARGWAERVLGERIPRSTWYRLVHTLARAGAIRVGDGRLEPVRSVDLYYSALWLLNPIMADLEVMNSLPCQD